MPVGRTVGQIIGKDCRGRTRFFSSATGLVEDLGYRGLPKTRRSILRRDCRFLNQATRSVRGFCLLDFIQCGIGQPRSPKNRLLGLAPEPVPNPGFFDSVDGRLRFFGQRSPACGGLRLHPAIRQPLGMHDWVAQAMRSYLSRGRTRFFFKFFFFVKRLSIRNPSAYRAQKRGKTPKKKKEGISLTTVLVGADQCRLAARQFGTGREGRENFCN